MPMYDQDQPPDPGGSGGSGIPQGDRSGHSGGMPGPAGASGQPDVWQQVLTDPAATGPPGKRRRIPWLHSRSGVGLTAAVLTFVVTLGTGLGTAPLWESRTGRSADPGQTTGTIVAPASTPAATVGSAQYSFAQPAGWEVPAAQDANTEVSGLEQQLTGPVSAEGVQANLGILRVQLRSRQRALDVIRQDYLILLRQRSPTAEQIGSPVSLDLDGADASSFEFRYEENGVSIGGRAVIAKHEDAAYLIVFKTGEADFDLHVNALWDVAQSWQWREGEPSGGEPGAENGAPPQP